MPDSFERAIALTHPSGDEHTFNLPDGWQQGRGAFGGLVLGAMLDAMIAREEDGARLARTLSGDLCGPALPGPTRILTRVLRRGKSQSNLAAALEQNGALVAHATCVLASERNVKAPPKLSLESPPRPPYESVAPIDLRPLGPRFAQHYEYRPTSPLPFSGGPRAELTGWLTERVPLSRVTHAAIVARLDAHWPAIYTVETAPRPIATVSFLAELLMDPRTLDPERPLYYRANAVAQAGGYFVEMRELWDGDELVALNQQSFAMLG
jgi:hypothetical protein